MFCGNKSSSLFPIVEVSVFSRYVVVCFVDCFFFLMYFDLVEIFLMCIGLLQSVFLLYLGGLVVFVPVHFLWVGNHI